MLLLHLNSYPLLEPVCDSFDIRALVEREGSPPAAGPAVLVEYDGLIPILGIFPNQYGHLLSAPATLRTPIVFAFDVSDYVG